MPISAIIPLKMDALSSSLSINTPSQSNITSSTFPALDDVCKAPLPSKAVIEAISF